MPSAFRRAGGGKAKIPVSNSTSSSIPGTSLIGYSGVKPWTGGIHLTSVGLNDLDVILGGGQPLGTCVLLREDRWTRDLALSLVKYWSAEAISQNQKLMIPTGKNRFQDTDFEASRHSEKSLVDFLPERDTVVDLLSTLPRNLHWDKQKKKDQDQMSSLVEASQSMTILEEDDDEVDDDLQVAWQYKKSVQQERLGLSKSSSSSSSQSNIFCHSYDLSGRMNEQRQLDFDSCICDLAFDANHDYDEQKKGLLMAQKLISSLEGAKSEAKTIRLLLYHTSLEILSVALPIVMSHIRQNLLPVVVMICSPPTEKVKAWTSICRTADTILSTEGFAARNEYPPPPEFRHLQGLLSLSKVSTVTAATANNGGNFADLTMSKRPAAFMYGFKRDRRKLHIPLLHIPPEDYAEGGGSVGSGVRSGGGKPPSDSSTKRTKSGGMGCASNMAGSPLDF